MSVPHLPVCPACGRALITTQLTCTACNLAISGRFAASPFAVLSSEQEEFVMTFLAARGNIKLVERRLGISYPTVRSRLGAVQKALGLVDLGAGEEPRGDVSDVLRRLEGGEISVDDAVSELE